MPAQRRHSQIIEVALKLFAENGFEGTSTRSIAEAAGISEALLFRHFPSKNDLYIAILEHKAEQVGGKEWQEELRSRARQKDDRGLFRAVVSKILEFYRQDTEFHRLMLYASLEGREIAQLSHRTLGVPVFGFLTDYIARRQREGAFQQCEPELAVFALLAIPSQYGTITHLFGVTVLQKCSEADIVDRTVSLVLDGLLRNPTK